MKNKKLLLVLSSFLLLGCNMGGSSISSEDLLSSEESGEIVSNESSPSSEENLSITGNGTKADPFKIYTVDNFVEFASSYNSSNEVVYYELANDIDLANVELAPIGTEEKPFVGAFNGAGKKISNFKLTNYSKSIGNYGLFGYVSNSYFHDLSLSVDIDLTVLGAKTSVSIGGLF